MYRGTMFEAIMIMCFGLSWPASIYRTYTAKKVTGKSLVFLWFVFFGYLSGIAHKVFFSYDWVLAFYVMNAGMVFVDIVLYYRYRNNGK
jgi:hypothetical protein